MAHSKIGASSMYRWSACPGSVRLSEGIPSFESAYAKEGTLAHDLAARMLLESPDKDLYSDEMWEACFSYAKIIIEEKQDGELFVEHKFDLSELYPGLFGTADAVIYYPQEKLLRVYDFKYWQGILVEVENNSQLKYYGLGALLSTKYPCEKVELVIVQPRADHVDGIVRRSRFDAIDLVEFASDLKNFAIKTSEENAPLNPGSHCRFCPASGICPALKQKALAIAKTEFSEVLSYDPVELASTLSKLDILEDYAKSVREFAYREAQHGRTPPGFKLVAKRATRKWKYEEIDMQSKVKTLGIEPKALYEMNLLSPAKVEKKIPELKNWMKELTVSVSSGLTLVPESDPRAEALSPAQNDFDVITD